MKCGSALTDGAKFCNNCGAPTGSEQPFAQPQPTAAQPFEEDERTVLLSTKNIPASNDTVMAAAPAEGVMPAQNMVSAPMQQARPVQQTAQPVPERPAVQYSQPAERPKTSSTKRNIIILVVVLVVLIAGAFTALFATGVIGGNSPEKMLETAEKYLDEKDYKQAIIQYEKLLEIDPLNVEVYLGLAEAYEANGDIDEAIEVLEKALKKLEDEKDIKKIEKALAKLKKNAEAEDTENDGTSEVAVADPIGPPDMEMITTAEVTTTTEAPEVSEPEVQLFDMNGIYGDWCAEHYVASFNATPGIANVNISPRGITIKTPFDELNYNASKVTVTEDGFYIDDRDAHGYLINFYYDDGLQQLTMCFEADISDIQSGYALPGYGNDYYMSRGVIEDVPDEGKVLNIWCWNDEFQSRVKEFYPGYVDNGDGTGTIGGVKVKWTINPNADNGYQIPLDAALKNQDNVSADEKIDIFLIEADYADKYVNSSYSLPVASVGITDADTAEMYSYTKEIATDKNGALKAVSWQACPGLFAYKRSIAMVVLGTDDPMEVQEYVADWDKFDETARRMKDAGYFMLSGYDDAYRVFSNNMSAPWVNDDNEIIIDDSLLRWVEQTKMYADNGYNNRNWLWSEGWAVDQGPDGKVFGFFYSTWGIDFTLMGNAGGAGFGDWAVCYGPQSFYWGGTWLCAGYQTDNPTLVHDIMYNMTCNADIMKSITLEVQDYTNNMTAMDEIAASDFRSDFLGGQNHIALFTENAKEIDMSNISPYDQGLNETFQDAFREYFDGNVDYDTALYNFYKNATTKYPELVRPID